MICNGRVALRMNERILVGEVRTLVKMLQATAEVVSIASTPDDNVEVAIDTPDGVATFFEQIQGIDSARRVEHLPDGLSLFLQLPALFVRHQPLAAGHFTL